MGVGRTSSEGRNKRNSHADHKRWLTESLSLPLIEVSIIKGDRLYRTGKPDSIPRNPVNFSNPESRAC